MKPDLDAIRARCDAATPGPWGFSRYEKRYLLDETTDVVGEVAPGSTGAAITVFAVATGALEDADFIARARTDIPALLAHIEELESRVTYTVGETEAAHRIAVAEQRFVDEYDQRKAACRVIDELEEQALTHKERLEQCEHERDQERKVYEMYMAEAQTDIRELRARITTLEAMKT
jgi:BMFP domain-containing protein YqiC